MTEPILNHQSSGKGLPLVLLHGFPHDSRIWESQLAALGDRFHVITPDLSGFGKSKSSEPFTMASQADSVHRFLVQIKALPCILGGLSMGGYIALEFARKYPSDLRGLILLDTRAEADGAEAKQGRGKMIDLVRANGAAAIAEAMLPKQLAPTAPQQKPDVVRKLRMIMESQSATTIENALIAMKDRPDNTAFLPSISVPTLIVVGQADVLTPPEVARKMHDAIPKSTLAIIPDAGHLSPMEQPGDVDRAISDYVSASIG